MIGLRSKVGRFWFLLPALKPGRIRHWLVMLVREFKANGVRGVLKRAQGTLSSPYALLAYSFDKLYAAGTLSSCNRLPSFSPVKGLTSVVIPVTQGDHALTVRKIASLSKRMGKDFEIIVPVSGWGPTARAMGETLSAKRGIKVFPLPADVSTERLLEKGAKEAQGEWVCFVSPEQGVAESTGLTDLCRSGRTVKNDHAFHASLPQKIAYIVPRLGLSGGIHVVLQHCRRLRDRGYDVCIVTLNPCLPEDHWPRIQAPVIEAGTDEEYLLDNIDVLIGTHWTTALYMGLLPARRKIYFVQSDERRFSPEDKREMKAIEATYRSDCEYMTEAIWIQRWLKEEFNHNAYYVPNGIDLNLFYRTDPLAPRGARPRILIEGGIDFWFKGMEDAYNAVKGLDVEIWIVSSQGRPKRHWRYDRFFQNVPIQEMKKIYSSCDVFLKMSKMEGFFGPPMEAMACGCPVVVGKVTGYDEYIEDGKNGLVVAPGDGKEASQAVRRLLVEQDLRERLVQGGYETVRKWSWDRTLEALDKVVKGGPPEIFYTASFPEVYRFSEWREKAIRRER